MLSAELKRRKGVPFKFEIGSGFLLLLALVYFFDDSGLLLAALPAVAVHELGHLLAMGLFGVRPLALSATMSGFSLDYSGSISAPKEMLTALAGPLLGLLFAVVCAKIGNRVQSEYLLLCAGLGVVLNAFNLLPALPLDGGRILSFFAFRVLGEAGAQRLVQALSLATALGLVGAGMYFLANGQGGAPALAGVWILLMTIGEKGEVYCS
ncbi:MAG: site-2 protease family protein [Oscillospiraceae bacterium]